ncbi:MAG: O-antigen ligase family protein [Bacteroidetes bacterium]|nr:O-antigen ligase family protein [Bacteroidota bacterium]
MTDRIKIAWLYLAAALFVALNLYLVVQKDFYLAFSLPIVLGILMLYIFSLDKVILLISFLTPLSVNIEDMDVGLAISLPVEPMLAGVLVLFIAKFLYERNYDSKIALHPIALVIYLMFGWMIITTFTSEIPLVSVKYIVSRLWFVVPSFFVAAMVFRRLNNLHWFIWLYTFSLIVIIFYTVINHASYGFSDDSAHWVMSPFYNDHTAYGAALAIYLIFSVAYAFYPGIKPWQRTLVFIVIGLLTVGTILSLSRAAWISIAAALGVFIAVLLHIKFRWILAAFATILILFFSFQHQIIDALEKNKQDSSNNLAEHVRSITNISSDASNLERINRWQAAIRMFNERPFFGWGPGTYQFVYAPFQRSKEKTIISTNAGDGGNAHSEYIGPLSEMGVIGMLLVFLLVGTMIYTGLRTHKRARNKEARILSLAATLALISYFVHGLLNNFLDTDKLSLPVWGSMAIIVVMDLYFADLEDIHSQESDKILPKEKDR